MAEITRRRLLQRGAAAAGGALVASLVPPNLRATMAMAPLRGSLRDIKHVVVVMQENRSFDHYFGTFAGVRGFADPDAITLPTGKSVFYQPTASNPDGYLLPWHLDTKTTSAQAIPSTSHAWGVQHEALDITVPSTPGRPTTAANDKWLPAHLSADGPTKGPFTMGYYERRDIPFHFALAESFTICDGYHCSLLGPTWPNRMYLMSGWIDPNGTAGGPITTNVVPTPPYSWTTYPERLEQAGISWQIYQEEDDYGCNVVEFFQSYQAATPGSGLYERGLTISQPGKFEYDALHDNLPTVTWIIPTSGKSEHPEYLPAGGSDWLSSKLEAVASNPDVWAKTLVIIDYDENDGLFDHVVPPLPPAGTADEFVDGDPIGGGVRVPCFLVSPWTVGGYVASELFDHTSVLQLLERITGVREPNISAWRRQQFGDFTSALGMSDGRPHPAPPLPKTARRFWEAECEVENLPAPTPPGAIQSFPVQEKHRHRRPPDWQRDAKPFKHRFHGQSALPQTTSRLLENRTNHAGDFEQRRYGNSHFPGMLEARIGKALSGSATHAWVPMVDAGAVAIIDTSSHEWVKAMVSETNPYGIAATPDGSKLYVTESGTNLVSSFEVSSLVGATSKQPGTTIVVGVYPQTVTVSPDGARAYVANTGPDAGRGGSNTVSVIDVATDAVVETIKVGQAPQGVAVSPDSKRLFVTCAQGLYMAHTANGHARLVSSDCAQAHGVACSPDGRWVFVADALHDRVLVLDGHGRSVAGRIKVGATPWNVALTPDSASAYVSNSNDDTVSVIDVAFGAVTDTISVSRIPTGISVLGNQAWVCGNVSSTVSVIDTTSNKVIKTVELGISSEPTTIAFA
ncbi:MAG TPA: alkaline phosphatase family protein [Solirubrobacteraceae bacterium]|nr:alkaline phosphatase family protein [Solirubrobacteraceae bacterium]